MIRNRKRVISGLIVVILSGCLAMGEVNSELSGVSKKEVVRTESIQMTGDDAFNLSPTLVITGGGWLTAILFLLSYFKSRKALKSIILSIEQAGDKKRVKDIKVVISKRALYEGIADYLHKIVQKVVGRKK